MTREEFIKLCRSELLKIDGRNDSNDHAYWMHAMAEEAQHLLVELNTKQHSKTTKHALFEQLIGAKIDASFTCFLPFYTDFGKNIHIGKNVFINMNCNFQDRGGIVLEDNVLIGMNVAIATLNHELNPKLRSITIPNKVIIRQNAWIGSNVTILPGVEIGENTIIAAGAVLTKNAEPNAIYAGVPAKKIKDLSDI